MSKREGVVRRMEESRNEGIVYRVAMVCAGVLLAAAAVWTTACLDSIAPRQISVDSLPQTDSLPGLTVSAPVPGVAGAGSVHNAVARAATNASVVYVSMPPGTVPTGQQADIRNAATNQSVTTGMVAGGFDPVAIPANAGDTLVVDITRNGGDSLHALHVVRGARPPVVVRTDPPPKKVDVPLNAVIVIVFSAPIDSATLNAGSVQLWRGAMPVVGSVRFSDGTRLKAEFLPSASLLGQTVHRLTVSQAIRDVNGVALEAPVETEFTTAGSAGAQSRIAYASYSVSNSGIYAVNADGSGRTLVVADVSPGGSYDASWSPDGTRLVFVSNRHAVGGGSQDHAIYVMNADGSGMVRLTYQGNAASPAWSPDGRKIAFTSGSRVYTMNADGSGVTQLTNDPLDGGPTWSPDGTQIAFSRQSGYTTPPVVTSELYVMNADGSGVRRLTNDQAYAGSPAWSPDGTRIAFASAPVDAANHAGNSEIYVTNVDGSGVSRLTDDPAEDASPTWSPDGTRIAFVSERAGTSSYYSQSQVFVMNADGSGVTVLTNDPVAARDPDWSHSGYVPAPPALSIEKAPTASGDGQADTVRATLPNPLRVRVLRGGVPAAGVTVTWSLGAGSVSAISTTTDAAGVASVTRTFADTATRSDWTSSGRLSRTLASVNGAIGSPVVFTATARPGNPTQLITHPGDVAGIGVVNSPIGVFRAIALDAYGNPVTGVRIVWTVTAGGGSVTPADPYGDSTRSGLDTTSNVGNGGSAWAQFTLGPNEGEQTATATAPTMPGAPVITYQRTAVTVLVQVFGSIGWVYETDNGFVPASVTVPLGKSVGWVVFVEEQHNLIFEDDPTEPVSSSTLYYGGTHVRTFSGAPRIIRYRCTLHSTSFTEGEVGTVIVN